MDESFRATSRDCEEKYERLTSPAARAVREATLGSAIPNGYTSSDQADRLADFLDLGEGDRLLDLGAGRGWPGSRIASRTGCRLVSTDLPWLAVRSSRDCFGAAGLHDAVALCADGRRLPFRDRAFDAVTHADVLC